MGLHLGGDRVLSVGDGLAEWWFTCVVHGGRGVVDVFRGKRPGLDAATFVVRFAVVFD